MNGAAPAKRGSAPPIDQAMDEADLIRQYFAPLAGGCSGAFDLTTTPPHSPAARLDLIVTTDALIAGVHFLPDDPPADIAAKALGVNLSDLAGKGADPLAYTLSIALTSPVSPDWLAAFSDGLAELQAEHGIASLIGGDTTRSPHALMLSITAIGTMPTGRMVRRSGRGPAICLRHRYDRRRRARPGAGDCRSTARRRVGPDPDAREALLSRYRRPQPRTAMARCVSATSRHAAWISRTAW